MSINQNRTPIVEMLDEFGKINPTYLCMPAHHRGLGADCKLTKLFGNKVFKYDLTETHITDDLHEAEGAIKEAEELASDFFGSDRTFFLVNGTTCGNEAMIISSVYEGDKILVARNCHKSILMGLIISGATPIYIEPEICEERHIFGSISPKSVKAAFEKNPDIKAFILVSPTYYGICSDLNTIADICHSYGAVLLVDEAHGAHLVLADSLPMSAMQSGADMSVQSIHKTAGSMTQSSMLHFKKGLCDISKIDSALRIVQSTSPSYVLMASLDAARHNLALNGQRLIKDTISLAKYMRENLNSIEGVKCFGDKSDENVFAEDLTRIVFSIDGIKGFDVYDSLFYKYNVCAEMADEFNIVIILSYADTLEQVSSLINAVKCIASTEKKEPKHSFNTPRVPPLAITPRKAYFSSTEYLPLVDATGTICGEMLAPYPPGIPIIYPGEIFTKEIIDFLVETIKHNRHIHGFSDKTMKTVKIIRP